MHALDRSTHRLATRRVDNAPGANLKPLVERDSIPQPGARQLPRRALVGPAHHDLNRFDLATVRLRLRVIVGPGSRAAGITMAFKLN